MLLPTKVQTLVDDGDEQASSAMLSTPSVPPSIRHVNNLFQPALTSATSNSAGPWQNPKSEDIPSEVNNGDLDWSYTSECIRRWSPNALLMHLYFHAFSVPPRNTNSSFPFVNISIVSQDGDDPEMVSLPQAYRLPLLMVAKYLWDTTLLALSGGQNEWMAQRANIFHISRLCENLFSGARVKTIKGGMERGWRCLMFDRFLARFYKHWTRNDPASNENFWKEHGAKEYDRDTLRLDWKRWCLRGQHGIRLTEQEINMGVNADQFRKTLLFNRETHTWTLAGNPLSFITSDEGPGWSSVSELTDVELEEEDEDVKPSPYAINDSAMALAPESPKQVPQSRTDSGSSVNRILRLRPQKDSTSGMSSAQVLHRKLPDPARLSTLRKSARFNSAQNSLPSVLGLNSAVCQTTPISETGTSHSVPSSHRIQTSTQPNRHDKRPHSRGIVVLIKRRPQVTTEGSAQSTGLGRSTQRPNISPGAVGPTQPTLSELSNRGSGPSLGKREKESDALRGAKRRRTEGFEIRTEAEDTAAQAPAYRPPLSSTNGSELNNDVCRPIHPTERGEGETQLADTRQVDVSIETMPVAIGVEQGIQTDGICTVSGLNLHRDVTFSSVSTPITTVTKRTTSNIAIQAEPNSFRNDSQMGDRIMEGHTAEIEKNLTSVVHNLVSSRLLSVTRALKQSSDPGPTLGSDTNGSSLCRTSALSSTRGPGMDGHLANALLDDLRVLREEAHAREQRTKEEMRALRHLHNVEVDSLRRRLAYLESQSQEQAVKDYGTGRANGEYTYGGSQTHYNGEDRTTRFGDRHHHIRDDDIPLSSFGASIRSPDRPIPGPLNGNGFSGRHSTTKSGNDVEEDSPLPSKAQRKSHIIAFSRPSLTR